MCPAPRMWDYLLCTTCPQFSRGFFAFRLVLAAKTTKELLAKLASNKYLTIETLNTEKLDKSQLEKATQYLSGEAVDFSDLYSKDAQKTEKQTKIFWLLLN